MEMRQCKAGGHYYDASFYAECPYCKNNQMNPNVVEDNRTIAIIKKEIGIDPVVGWLVCVVGKEKGRDYRIHSDNNFIGRSEKMDICIKADTSISRENHAVISYDVKEKIFYLTPGEGRSILRLNEKAIFATEQLKDQDMIEIGETKLLFVPLCSERFEWN